MGGKAMFDYRDPVGTGLLEKVGALDDYRQLLHAQYRAFARLPRSSFTLLEAFDGVLSKADEVTWLAFPRTANAQDAEIDAFRFTGGPEGDGFQDEYVEWQFERGPNGATRVVFATEFPEYFEACAGRGFPALQAAVEDVIPGASPTVEELFGPGFDPMTASKSARQSRFVDHLARNPWQTGAKGILCLQQRFNTLGALFNLVGECAVLLAGDAGSACANAKDGACGPERASDPNICAAVQGLRRSSRVVSLEDPVGVRILALGGIWTLDGQQIDINDPAANQGAWRIERNGRRATLTAPAGLRLSNNPIVSGAQVAKALRVGARVVSASETDVPAWARTGQESSRRLARAAARGR